MPPDPPYKSVIYALSESQILVYCLKKISPLKHKILYENPAYMFLQMLITVESGGEARTMTQR